MSGKLLDTNFIINSAMGKLKKPEWISLERNIFISEITFGEILYGIECSKQKDENRKLYARFCDKFSYLPITRNVTEEYARIKAFLRKTGNLIPENDIWIAATAKAHGLAIVTDDGHFKNVPDLVVEEYEK